MNRLTRLAVLAILATLGMAFASPEAHALPKPPPSGTVPFTKINFTSTSGTPFSFGPTTPTGTDSLKLSGPQTVDLSYTNGGATTVIQGVTLTFTPLTTTLKASTSTILLDPPNLTPSITILTQPFNTASTSTITLTKTVGGVTTNYLTDIITGGFISGTTPNTVANYTAGTSHFFSSFFRLPPTTAKETSQLALSNISSDYTKGSKYLTPFVASSSGQFTAPATVPEPATFAMLGMGLMGIPVLQLIRRRKANRVNA